MKSMRQAQKLAEKGCTGDVVRTSAFLIQNESEGKDYVQEAEESGEIGIRFWDEAPQMMYLTQAFNGDLKGL